MWARWQLLEKWHWFQTPAHAGVRHLFFFFFFFFPPFLSPINMSNADKRTFSQVKNIFKVHLLPIKMHNWLFFSTNTLGIFLDNLNLGKKILVLSMRVAEQLLQECLDFLSPLRWGKTRAFVCFLADVQHFCQYLLLWFRISFHLPSRLSKFAFPLR